MISLRSGGPYKHSVHSIAHHFEVSRDKENGRRNVPYGGSYDSSIFVRELGRFFLRATGRSLLIARGERPALLVRITTVSMLPFQIPRYGWVRSNDFP